MKSSAKVVRQAAYFPRQRKVEQVTMKELEFLNFLLDREFNKRKLSSSLTDSLLTKEIKNKMLKDIQEMLSCNTAANLIYVVDYLEEVKEAIANVSVEINQMFKKD